MKESSFLFYDWASSNIKIATLKIIVRLFDGWVVKVFFFKVAQSLKTETDIPILRFLAENGTDLNVNDKRDTLLIESVKNNYGIFEELLRLKADVNRPGMWEYTPLFMPSLNAPSIMLNSY